MTESLRTGLSRKTEPAQSSGLRACLRTAFFAAAVAAVTFVVFLPALSNRFVNWDDPMLILENFHIRKLDAAHIGWMFTSSYKGPYQPLPWLSLGVDYSIWGYDPRGFHLTSLLWHAASAASFFLVARRLLMLALPESSGRPLSLTFCAAFSALFFAIHPLRCESVVWVSERRDVLSGFFAVWTVWAYLRAVTAPERRSIGWMGVSAILFLCSLLCKATPMCLPAVLTVLDFYPLRRLKASWRELILPAARSVWLEKVPFWLLSVIGASTALLGQKGAGSVVGLEAHGPLERIALAGFGSVFYVWKTIIPLDLSPYYDIPNDFHAGQVRFVLPGLLCLAGTVVLLRLRRHVPAALTVWISYLLLLAPVSGLAQTGGQLAADRYSYLPCLGFALLVGGLILRAHTTFGDWHGRMALAVATAAAVLLARLTWMQSGVWRDSESLWRHALTVDPTSSTARTNLARAFLEDNRLEEARRLFEESLSIRPRNADAHNNLGVVLRRLERFQEAMEHYLAAEQLRANSADIKYNIGLLLAEEDLHDALGFASLEQQWEAAARRLGQAVALEPEHVGILNALGIVYKHLGNVDEAIHQYGRAMRVNPDDVHSHYNLAIALTDRGMEDSAMMHYRFVLQLQPDFAAASNNLAELLEQRAEYHQAVLVLRDALSRTQDHPVLLGHLSWTLATSPDPSARDGAESVRCAGRALAILGGSDARSLDVLAAAYAEAGRFDAAVETESLACRIAREQEKLNLAGQMEQRLELFRAGKPFRTPQRPSADADGK